MDACVDDAFRLRDTFERHRIAIASQLSASAHQSNKPATVLIRRKVLNKNYGLINHIRAPWHDNIAENNFTTFEWQFDTTNAKGLATIGRNQLFSNSWMFSYVVKFILFVCFCENQMCIHVNDAQIKNNTSCTQWFNGWTRTHKTQHITQQTTSKNDSGEAITFLEWHSFRPRRRRRRHHFGIVRNVCRQLSTIWSWHTRTHTLVFEQSSADTAITSEWNGCWILGTLIRSKCRRRDLTLNFTSVWSNCQIGYDMLSSRPERWRRWWPKTPPQAETFIRRLSLRNQTIYVLNNSFIGEHEHSQAIKCAYSTDTSRVDDDEPIFADHAPD